MYVKYSSVVHLRNHICVCNAFLPKLGGFTHMRDIFFFFFYLFNHTHGYMIFSVGT